MKKTSFFIFSTAILLNVQFACKNKPSEEMPKNFPLVESKKQPSSVLPTDNLVTNLMLQMDQHTWKDLDKIYREELPKYQDEPFYANLKKIAIYHLVKDFHMEESADGATVAFYTNELTRLNLIDPLVLGKLVEKLKGVWTEQQIQQLVANEYKRNMGYAQTKLPNPEQYLSVHGKNWEKLLVLNQKSAN